MAKDFLSYVYTDERWLDYAAGAIPASKRVSDRYGADIPSYDLFRANADNVWDFTGGSPDTQTVRDVFYTGIHDLLMGQDDSRGVRRLFGRALQRRHRRRLGQKPTARVGVRFSQTGNHGNGHCRADQGIAQKEERAALSRVAKGDPPTTKY